MRMRACIKTKEAQSKRESADFDISKSEGFAQMQASTSVRHAAGRSSNRSAACFLYRYPSPDRPAHSLSRPTTVFRPSSTKFSVVIGYHVNVAIDLTSVSADCGATLKTTIGRRLCKKHQSSLPQWLCLAWPVASKVTQNVALPVQARALWPLNFLAQTAQVQCLPVQPQAYFVTTQASTPAVNLDNRAHCGRIHFKSRRRGSTPAAVLCFGD